MILADKIINLRKKNGWSQEELAEKMNVSRQSVSKWESAQSVPDLGKILQLSSLFGVTTDYLLKDEMENEEFADDTYSDPIKKVTLKEANEFLELREKDSKKIALATFACIISPICLIFLTSASELKILGISENTACAIGLGVLLLLVSIAVCVFLSCGFRNSPYEFLEKGDFETEYGVIGMVREKKKSFHNTYAKLNIFGTCLCVISPIPLLVASLSEKEFLSVIMLCLLLFLVGIGVISFIVAGIQHESMQKLLKEGDFSEKGKKKERAETVYWLLATAIYLSWSFISSDWHMTWIVWPIAAVIYPIYHMIYEMIIEK